MAFFRSCFLRGVLGAFLVLLAAAIILPQYADYRERDANAEIFDEAALIRQSIEARILELGSVENSGVGLQASAGKSYEAIVTREGTILLQGMRYGHVLALIPSLVEGAVSWHCIGGPPKDMPRQCRGK